MKNKTEIYQSPKQTKYDTIQDKDRYLEEKLISWRNEFKNTPVKEEPKTKKQYIFYALAGVALIVGLLLRFFVEPEYIGYFLIAGASVLIIIGSVISPRKSYETIINPFELKLMKPLSLEFWSSRVDKQIKYSCFFEFEDVYGNLLSASTAYDYSEEEKEKICKSFLNGNVIVAVDMLHIKDAIPDCAVILEY